MSVRKRVRQKGFAGTTQEAVVSLLVAASHARQELEEVCRAHGLTHDQYNVLRILRGVHPEGHPRYRIGERLMERSPDVTRLLDRLERQGLVERYRSEEDLRLSFSRITDDGLELLASMEAPMADAQAAITRPLEPDEQRELIHLCGKLTPPA